MVAKQKLESSAPVLQSFLFLPSFLSPLSQKLIFIPTTWTWWIILAQKSCSLKSFTHIILEFFLIRRGLLAKASISRQPIGKLIGPIRDHWKLGPSSKLLVARNIIFPVGASYVILLSYLAPLHFFPTDAMFLFSSLSWKMLPWGYGLSNIRKAVMKFTTSRMTDFIIPAANQIIF